MVRAEAGIDERELLGLGIIDGDLARVLDEAVGRSGERVELGRAQRRIALAVIRRILGRALLGGEIDPAVLVHHRIVRIDLRVPDLLGAPIGRRRQHRIGQGRARRALGIADRHLHDGLGVVHRIEDRQVVGGELGRPIDQSVAVDGRIAFVGERQVVQVMLGVRPVPHRHHDIALDAGRPRRRRARQLAGLDAIGPIRQRRQMAAARRQQRRHVGDHGQAGRPRLQAPRPGLDRGVEMAERLRDGTGRVIADLMAIAAAVGLDRVQPLILGLVLDRDAVAVGTGARKLAGVGNPDHREPIDRRIILRCGGEIGRHHGGQVEIPAGRARDLRGIHQPVAAHPYLVGGRRKVGQHVAPAVVGDHHLGEAGAEIAGLRDHPDAGLRPEPARHRAADRMRVDLDRGRCRRARLGIQARRQRGCQHRDEGGQQVLVAHDTISRRPVDQGSRPRRFDVLHARNYTTL